VRVLITGGCGLVGRHMTRHFLDRGHTVVGIDSMVEGGGGIHPSDGWFDGYDPESSGRYTLYQEDCRGLFRDNCLGGEEQTFDLVLHLAAVVGGRLTIEQQPLQVADDLSIDAAMWQWAAEYRPGRVVYFSSSAAYPVLMQDMSERLRMGESDLDLSGHDWIGMPDLSYGWAKMTGEYVGMLAAQRAGVSHVVYRPFSGYAEDQGDEYPMTAICLRALTTVMRTGVGTQSIEVWGDGHQTRDWIHMDDICRMVYETCTAVPPGTTLNLCTGVPTSMREVTTQAVSVAARLLCVPTPELEIVPKSDRPVGVMYRVGDPSLLETLTAPASISVAEGIERVIMGLLS